jgi:uncharacterized protein YjbI with pentapeptide repeats
MSRGAKIISGDDSSDWQHKNLEEASKNTRGIFYLYLGAVAYCLLTVMGTSDRQLLLGERTQLPIVNVAVPLVGFFYFSPLLLMLVYAYFQMYLQRIQGLKSQLRSTGSWQYRRIYPWMINIADDPEPGLVGRAQKIVVALALWWSLPLVMQVFYLWILKRHDRLMSTVLFCESAAGMALVIISWWLYHKRTRFEKIKFAILMIAWFCIPHFLLGPKYLPRLPQRVVQFISNAGFGPNLNLSFQNLIEEKNAKYSTIPLVNLRGVDLTWATLNSCILARADLRDAKLQHAYLEKSDFRGAWFTGANLDSSSAQYARFDSSIDSSASFVGTNLSHANFQHATLKRVDFRGAQLVDVRLDSAVADSARFEGCIMYDIVFTGANLNSCIFSHTKLSNVELRHAQLKNANFIGSHLEGFHVDTATADSAIFDTCSIALADFSGSQMRYASFKNSTVTLSSFYGANLLNTNFRNSTISLVGFDSILFANADMTHSLLLMAHFGQNYWAPGSNSGFFILDSSVITKGTFEGRICASFKSAEIGEVHFDKVNLSQSNFSKATLRTVTFNKADLSWANFDSAKFFEVDFKDANLSGAYLIRSRLWGADSAGIAPSAFVSLEQLSKTSAIYGAILNPDSVAKIPRNSELWQNLVTEPSEYSN